MLASPIILAQEKCDVMSPLSAMNSVLHVDKCKILRNGKLHSGLVSLFNFKKESDPVQGIQMMITVNCAEKRIKFDGYVIVDDMFSEDRKGTGITGVETSEFQLVETGKLGEKISNLLCDN